MFILMLLDIIYVLSLFRCLDVYRQIHIVIINVYCICLSRAVYCIQQPLAYSFFPLPLSLKQLALALRPSVPVKAGRQGVPQSSSLVITSLTAYRSSWHHAGLEWGQLPFYENFCQNKSMPCSRQKTTTEIWESQLGSNWIWIQRKSN